jgi:hypothetical protein
VRQSHPSQTTEILYADKSSSQYLLPASEASMVVRSCARGRDGTGDRLQQGVEQAGVQPVPITAMTAQQGVPAGRRGTAVPATRPQQPRHRSPDRSVGL